MLPEGWGSVLKSNVSASIQTVVGTFGKGDMLVWRSADRNLEVGRARSFMEVCTSGRYKPIYLAMADKFRNRSRLLYSEPPAGQLPVLVNMEFILGNFSWVDYGDKVYGDKVDILLPVGV